MDDDDDDDDYDDGGEGDFHLDENPVCSHTSLTSVSEFCPHQTFSKISSDCCPKCCQSLRKLVFQTFFTKIFKRRIILMRMTIS